MGRVILFTGGIGDIFAVEGMMTTDERRTLSHVYYLCPAASIVHGLFRALPTFPALRRHSIPNTRRRVFRSLRAAQRRGYTVPDGTEDWSISAIFPQGRPYTVSSFLAHKLTEPRPVPGPYVVIQPVSSWGRWPERDLDDSDWQRVREFLEARGLIGLILNQHGSPLPDWPCLLGWQGITSLAESIELLKGAEGYLGIDSCLSVLAAKLFPANRLAIKGTRAHVYQCAWAYYQPHTTFPFLQQTLVPPPWD